MDVYSAFSDGESDEDEFVFERSDVPASSMPSFVKDRSLHSLNSLIPQPQQVKQSQLDLEDFRIAAMKGNVEVLKGYLQSGVPVDQVLRSGWTALMYAASCGHWEAVELLLQEKANPNFHKELFTPLMAACASSSESEDDLVKCVNLLLQKGAAVNASERHKVTALMFACKERRLKIVKALLCREELSLNLQDNRGWTALMWAADRGDGAIVRTLLEHGEFGADKSLMSTSGQKAVDVALIAGHKEVAALLDLSLKPETAGSTQPSSLLRPPSAEQPAVVVTELETVLMGLDLSELIPVFHEHKMTYDALLLLDDEDLDRMGITQVGHRTKLLNAVKEIHTKDWERGSLPAVQYNKYLTCPAATALMGNLAIHSRYMLASVAYLRDQIQRKPRILQLGMETASVHALSAQTQHAMKQVQELQLQLKFLKLYLDKVQDKAEYVPADLITEKNVQSRTQTARKELSGSRLGRWAQYAVTFLVVLTGGLVLCSVPSFSQRSSAVLLVA